MLPWSRFNQSSATARTVLRGAFCSFRFALLSPAGSAPPATMPNSRRASLRAVVRRPGRAMLSDRDALGRAASTATSTVLNDVDLAAARRDLQAETAQLAIPQERVLCPGVASSTVRLVIAGMVRSGDYWSHHSKHAKGKQRNSQERSAITQARNISRLACCRNRSERPGNASLLLEQQNSVELALT